MTGAPDRASFDAPKLWPMKQKLARICSLSSWLAGRLAGWMAGRLQAACCSEARARIYVLQWRRDFGPQTLYALWYQRSR